MKELTYLDMDDTLCDYKGQFQKYKYLYPEVEFPQSIEGIFETMQPNLNAIEVAKKLSDHPKFKVFILTAPSIYNPLCYTEKRIWVEKHLGFDWVEKLIIAFDKSLLKGNYLVDDYISGRGQENFEGDVIHFGSSEFPDWISVFNHLNKV